MAVYQQLLLSTGGGIISSQQQAQQTKDTATVLIGLGGTGVHCIRTIKSQVYTRLKPDDEEAVVPAYEHIRFIGVDTDLKSRGGALTENPNEEQDRRNAIMALEDTEFFPIANRQVQRALNNELALKQRAEMSWLEYNRIEVPNLTDAGAGGIRQVGRFMMMDRSQDFMARIEQEIGAAKRGLNNPRVNVHIFAGLSGGTGSGCFLDVCYMVRSISQRIGGVTVFGYFFLPDVNLSTIPYENTNVRAYIPKNGYAAMQELDYCMAMPKNGGSFEQVYQGHKTIRWDAPPVDMCHLICATDKDNNEIPNAYNYAMNVTAEYVMDFLTASTQQFDLTQHLSNFRSMIVEADAKKTIGSEMAYCIIGASCATIPLREINTYLASELFNAFGTIKKNMPSKADVEKLAIAALARDAQNVSGIYDSLYREIRERAPGEYGEYPDDWKFVRDYGNSELVQHYTNQTASQLNHVETNAQSMITVGNRQSLLGRVHAQMQEILRDIKRGPIYAYRMFAASESHNFLNIVDGLIAENTSRWNQEAAQSDLRLSDYETAKRDFENRTRRSMFDKDEKRFNDYEYYLMLLEQHKLTMQVYERLNTVLTGFRQQVVDFTAAYYIKLYRVMDTLINTFAENRSALANPQMLQNNNDFDIPMMTIQELKPTLDAEIARIDIPNMLDSFVVLLLNHEDDWIMEDANKITRLVRDFFVTTAFQNFANKTITSFLTDKYQNKFGGLVTNAQLTNYIYNDWMKMLTDKASPLFYFNSSIWKESETSKLAFISFPNASAPIQAAAQQMHNTSQLWGLKDSALTDRIFVMCSACGLPLGAYNNCTEYEQMFFSAKNAGRHYYEGRPNPSISFTDWNLLPSVTPQSVINEASVPEDLRKLLVEERNLFEKAREYGVLDADGYICMPKAGELRAVQEACDACEARIAATTKVKDVPALEAALQELNKFASLEMERTDFQLPTDGYRKSAEDITRIQKDRFVSSPAIHENVRAIVSEIDSAVTRKSKVVSAAAQKISDVKASSSFLEDFCDAIFTGVIALQGRLVVYHQEHFGIENDIILSQRGENFPFGAIPVYQGYVNFMKMPAEIRAEIKKEANNRINSDAPVLYSTGKALKEFLIADRNKAWQQAAVQFSQYTEIIEFLSEFNKRFNTYCLENGL